MEYGTSWKDFADIDRNTSIQVNSFSCSILKVRSSVMPVPLESYLYITLWQMAGYTLLILFLMVKFFLSQRLSTFE